MSWVTGRLHGEGPGVVIAEVDEQVMFCRFNAFKVLMVKIAFDEGLIMVSVAYGTLVYDYHLNEKGKTL